MNSEWERFVAILCEKWIEGKVAIGTDEVYSHLLSEGFQPRTNVLRELLMQLESQGMIGGSTLPDQRNVERHGAMVITYVSPDLCQ